jgi:hypothetical protein
MEWIGEDDPCEGVILFFLAGKADERNLQGEFTSL